MKLGCIYLCVGNIQKSLEFYKQLLQQEPTHQNEDRWIQFNIGNTFALYNGQYDEEIMHSSQDISQYFNYEYQKDFDNASHHYNNNIVLNFVVDNLNEEYKRIKSLDIGKVSHLYYVNITQPYWYFTIEDPDGNQCEITGAYYE
ncbi:VOC family protein [Candidatus Stoquefichus massiliensis]|uniref:VOC family protein n=1 Tax=Candidatus Stoquefichus massiliensis TaxID=1470350 RepID=UPI000489E116|nr:VOC family protein [Candidatus Stoquefichus massiliensis]